ncbi:MAG: hypothetical protein UDG86_02380 [Lachnospiraceae bacterium]|nr:hypothetical protein [Lachnospiraceae bacterium]
MNKRMEDTLAKGIGDIAPDVYSKIINAPFSETASEDWLPQPASRSKALYRTAAVLAACLILLLGVIYYSGNLLTDTVISLDVNPSLELKVNKKDLVLDVTPLNADGETILAGMNLYKTDLDVAVNALIGSMVRNGYITELTNTILVSVSNKDTVKADQIKDSIVLDIRETLSQSDISADIYEQQISETKDIQEIAKKYGISVGKASFLLKLTQQDASLSLEELAHMSMEEIAEIIRSRKIDISGFAGYEADESLMENLEEILEEEQESQKKGNPTDAPSVKENPRSVQNPKSNTYGSKGDPDDWDDSFNDDYNSSHDDDDDDYHDSDDYDSDDDYDDDYDDDDYDDDYD